MSAPLSREATEVLHALGLGLQCEMATQGWLFLPGKVPDGFVRREPSNPAVSDAAVAELVALGFAVAEPIDGHRMLVPTPLGNAYADAEIRTAINSLWPPASDAASKTHQTEKRRRPY
jgi:hypothetical protein